MKTEIGEQIVGAYLKLCCACAFVDYNVRPPGGGLKGLAELDVVGLDLDSKRAYLCEVTTHICGLQYGTLPNTIKRVRDKHARQRRYASEYLTAFSDIHFMFWSPVVPVGYLTEGLSKIGGLELVINANYARCVDELRKLAHSVTHDVGNDFFRSLQILERLRR